MIFFQSQVSDRQPGRQRFCHIADVPGFVRHAGDLFFIFRIPENKAIERSITFQPSPFSGGSEFFAQFHMEGRTGNIKGQSALVLACTWNSYKSAPCKKLLLSLKRAVAGDCPPDSGRTYGRHGRAGKPPLQPGIPEDVSDLPVQPQKAADINKMLRHKSFRQRMFPADQPGIKISVHKKTPFPYP